MLDGGVIGHRLWEEAIDESSLGLVPQDNELGAVGA